MMIMMMDVDDVVDNNINHDCDDNISDEHKENIFLCEIIKS